MANSRRTLKIAGIVAGVIVAVALILIFVAPGVTPSPNSTATEESPPGTINWSLVEIGDITILEGLHYYMIGYTYPPVWGSWVTHFVYVDVEQYSPQAVKQAIEKDILARLAEIQEQERLKQEIEEALPS